MLDSERLVPTGKKDAFYLEHIQRYKFAAKYCKGKKVLDLGCGTGYGSHCLATHGAKTVFGVDIDDKAISYANSKFEARNSKFLTANAQKLPFSTNTFDVVVSFEVIEHLDDYKKFIKEALRVLKPNGYFIFSTPNALQYRAGTSLYHTKEFTPKELINLFPNIELYGQFYLNKKFVKEESEYFKRYNKLTLGGNKIIKKLLHLIPSELKASIYRIFWPPLSPVKEKEIVIRKRKINEAVTLIGVCQRSTIYSWTRHLHQ